jgi:hypothetical protein
VILPSPTPVGTGTLTVNNNGQTASTSIQVVQSAFGILTVNNPITFSASGIDLGFAAALIFDYTGLGTGFYYQ